MAVFANRRDDRVGQPSGNRWFNRRSASASASAASRCTGKPRSEPGAGRRRAAAGRSPSRTSCKRFIVGPQPPRVERERSDCDRSWAVIPGGGRWGRPLAHLARGHGYAERSNTSSRARCSHVFTVPNRPVDGFPDLLVTLPLLVEQDEYFAVLVAEGINGGTDFRSQFGRVVHGRWSGVSCR